MPSLPRAVPMLTQPGASVDGWVGEEVDTYLGMYVHIRVCARGCVRAHMRDNLPCLPL